MINLHRFLVEPPTADQIIAAPAILVSWAPIESADRDGTVVLLAHIDGDCTHVTPGWFCEDDNGWWEMNTHPTDYVDRPVPAPFAWAPFPDPPRIAK